MSNNPGYAPRNTISPYLALDFQLPQEESKFREFIAERERTTATILNTHEIGQYELQELLSGKTFYSEGQSPRKPRYVFRKVLQWEDETNEDSPNLPNTTIGSMLHGITLTSDGFFTNIYAVSKNPAAVAGEQKYIKISFASPTSADNIAIWCDDNRVYIETGKDRSAWTETNIILEYIKA